MLQLHTKTIEYLGSHILINDDMRNIGYYDIPVCDMLLTDPPYGVNYQGGHFHSGNPSIHRVRTVPGDNEYKPFSDVVYPFVHGPVYVFSAGAKIPDVMSDIVGHYKLNALLVWVKTNAKFPAINAHFKQDVEYIIHSTDKRRTVEWLGGTRERVTQYYKRPSANKYHPTQKPTELLEHLIGLYNVTTILDCYAGSGSTLVAAEHMKKTCICIETDKHYVDTIKDRYYAGE